jgi:hypothetical protein
MRWNAFSENKERISILDNRNYLIESTLEVLEQELDAVIELIENLSSDQSIKEIVVYSNSRLRFLPSMERMRLSSREK